MGSSFTSQPISANMLLILACASLVAVYAQQPTPCQTPPQWQGKFARRDDLKNKNCTVGSLTRPFRPFGIPPEANYTGSANVGPVNIPDEHATIVLFEGRNEREGFYFYGEVTAPDCIPVANGFYSNKTGYEHTDFFDITGGIPDPTVFIPPQGCKPV